MSMSDEKRLRAEICEAGRRLYARNMVASNDGNITARLKDGHILATPTGVSKGSISPDMICKLNAEGEQLEGYLSPSSEIRLHLHCYRRRPDVHAVAHAHPPKATGFALAGLPLDELTLPETIVSFGCIPLAPYATPGGEKLPQSIDHLIESCDAILLANHGAVTVGGSPMDAYYKMETLEHTAHITWVAKTLGGVKELTNQEARELLELRERLGLGSRVPLCDVNPRIQEANQGASSAETEEMNEERLTALIERVAAEVLKERAASSS